MWAFLLDPGVQAVLGLGAIGALATIVYDLYDGPSAASAAQPRSRSRSRSNKHPISAPPPNPNRRNDAKLEPSVEFWERDGQLMGRVRRGPCRGLDLAALTPAQFQDQLAYARAHDPGTAARLEEVLRRAVPPPRATGEMTRADAFAELGLREGAGDAEVHAAYRKLIKRHHPDHGGSHAKAARINQAKAILD